MAVVSYEVLSKAKINLMLRVLCRREDGYHNLQSAFQLLQWGDRMKFTELDSVGTNQTTISGFDIKQADNLIYQAAEALKPWAKQPSDWIIEVEKTIPQGAGLGGGSSNAAETLRFLNHHWACKLSQTDLMSIGAKLGADVPIFLAGKSAFGGGIGDQLENQVFHTPYILLVFPKVSINTAHMFNHPLLLRNQASLNGHHKMNSAFWTNDFFPLVLQDYPEVNSIYNAVKGHVQLRLSGTGSTLFAVFETLKGAIKAQKIINDVAESQLVKASDTIN